MAEERNIRFARLLNPLIYLLRNTRYRDSDTVGSEYVHNRDGSQRDHLYNTNTHFIFNRRPSYNFVNFLSPNTGILEKSMAITIFKKVDEHDEIKLKFYLVPRNCERIISKDGSDIHYTPTPDDFILKLDFAIIPDEAIEEVNGTFYLIINNFRYPVHDHEEGDSAFIVLDLTIDSDQLLELVDTLIRLHFVYLDTPSED